VTLVGQLVGEVGQRSVGFVAEQGGHDLHRERQPAAQLDQPFRGGRVGRHARVAGVAAVEAAGEQLDRRGGLQDVQVEQPGIRQCGEGVPGGDQYPVPANPTRQHLRDLLGVADVVEHQQHRPPRLGALVEQLVVDGGLVGLAGRTCSPGTSRARSSPA
jgi:hypothetical protein